MRIALMLAFNVTSCFTFFSADSFAQSKHIELNRLTTLDEPSDHFEILTPFPSKIVTLPHVDTTGARFLKVFYSWKETTDPDIVIMVLSKRDGELLYIDRNYDNDLSNDGPPILFRTTDKEITFDISSRRDSLQRVTLRLSRFPHMDGLPDSIRAKYTDSAGNLNPAFAHFAGGLMGEIGFTGMKGSFFWDDRVTVRRGAFTTGDHQIEIGLFDKSNNGLFNDDDDCILVDASGKGLLSFLNGSVYKLTDVFPCGSAHYLIGALDKYGKWVEIEKISAPLTSYFLHDRDSVYAKELLTGEHALVLDSTFWEIASTALSGERIEMKSYRGKHILLNFWGEWCQPCLKEIPDLVMAYDSLSRGDWQFISLLKSSDIQKAKKIINQQRITWPQVVLAPEIEERFRIAKYPTNLLVNLNGTGVSELGSISLQVLRSMNR